MNPRIGCTFRLFVAINGMDVARALYLDMTGRPVGSAVVEDGRKWMIEDFDLLSALRRNCDGRLTWKEWVGSLVGIDEAACFALDDPLPLLLAGITDLWDLYRWFRQRSCAAKEKPVQAAADNNPVLWA